MAEKTGLLYQYIEDPEKIIHGSWIDSEALQVFTDTFVTLCVDIVPVNFERKTIFLAERKIKPANGWWWIGGRMFAGEDFLEAAKRVLKKEASLDVEKKRLIFHSFRRYIWKDREGNSEQQNRGRDDLVITFLLAISDDELQECNLESREYASKKLTEFGANQLFTTQIRQPVRELYTSIFVEY